MTAKNSLDINNICKHRRIRKIDIETPLLVPSFSSVVLSNIREIHSNLKDHISTASLISAYDLHYGFINEAEIWVSDVVFIDSGNYEVEYLKRVSSKRRRPWSLSKYVQLIESLKPLTALAIINFDVKQSLKSQISRASNLFKEFENYASCFLYKPTSNSANFVEISSLIKNITLLEPFDILGIAEKELGNSLLRRCENLLKIRKALNDKDFNTPIHIFGCFDPLTVVSYFICGADIFDGTSWLKFTFHKNVATYVSNHAFLKGGWSESDNGVQASAYVLNLKELTHLMHYMRRFAREYNFDVLGLETDILKEVKDLTGTAGIRF